MNADKYIDLSVQLLSKLISIPSVSRDEKLAADHLEAFLKGMGQKPVRRDNNILLRHDISDQLPCILLNSHIDTVKPVEGWTKDPITATIDKDRK